MYRNPCAFDTRLAVTNVWIDRYAFIHNKTPILANMKLNYETVAHRLALCLLKIKLTWLVEFCNFLSLWKGENAPDNITYNWSEKGRGQILHSN
jgi:hypothetical protein